MTDKMLYAKASKFRMAIDMAKNKGRFADDINLCNFPRCSCRDVSDLLAEYLFGEGIESIIVYTDDRYNGSHSWIVVKNEQVLMPKKKYYEYPEYIADVICSYGGEGVIENRNYTEEDIINGTIIDITGSQYDKTYNDTYVGPMDDFHEQFDFVYAEDFNGFTSERLNRLYRIIISEMT